MFYIRYSWFNFWFFLFRESIREKDFKGENMIQWDLVKGRKNYYCGGYNYWENDSL